MIPNREYCITIHQTPAKMGEYVKHAIYTILCQRNYHPPNGYECGEFEGISLLVPCDNDFKTYIGKIIAVVQDSIDKNTTEGIIMHIYWNTSRLESWRINFDLKHDEEESVLSDFKDMIQKIVEMASNIILLPYGCEMQINFEECYKE
ncbi:uncharacterized protein LOC128307165 [Anopheles moucheti]|uniref:uncharacterized protein LOC128307165 n=1 Tax=Anopheles moucheti TaxID=186751 RepID=UPI0022F0720F|nr:uncharacterized protein LOC128307165 [Anopheles moucheti]